MDSDLEKLISVEGKTYVFPPDELQIISFVLDYARRKHGETRRKNGELYIVHPLGVAKTLIDYCADYITICAGLLHDVVEEELDAKKVGDAEVGKVEEGLFASLQEGMQTHLAESLVRPLLPREELSLRLVKEYATHSATLQVVYEKRIAQEMWTYAEARLGEDITDAEFRRDLGEQYDRKKKWMARQIPREIKRILRERHGCEPKDEEALETIVHFAHDIALIVDIVKLLTREKSCSYYKSICNMYAEKDKEKKSRALLVKMADALDNIKDSREPRFTNTERLYRCFKNMIVLNFAKKYFLKESMPRTDAPYQLFIETCKRTYLALKDIARKLQGDMQLGTEEWDWRMQEYDRQHKGLTRVTKANELDPVFCGRLTKYDFYMHGYKDILEKDLANSENQYIDAIAFKAIMAKLAFEDTYTMQDSRLETLFTEAKAGQKV
ncbi:HD domain-containing protein [Candidatus Woesearchaeota archaeon]|nr:HD domain-containing protein [Candidatus Woesearchaeota archaeon]